MDKHQKYSDFIGFSCFMEMEALAYCHNSPERNATFIKRLIAFSKKYRAHSFLLFHKTLSRQLNEDANLAGKISVHIAYKIKNKGFLEKDEWILFVDLLIINRDYTRATILANELLDIFPDDADISNIFSSIISHKNIIYSSTGEDNIRWKKYYAISAKEFNDLEKNAKEEMIDVLSFPWIDSGSNKSPSPSLLKVFWAASPDRQLMMSAVSSYLADKFQSISAIKNHNIHQFFLFFELMLREEHYKVVTDYGARVSYLFPKDLRIQDLRARAHILAKNPSLVKKDIANGFNTFEKFFCEKPFRNFTATVSGDVSVCCSNWLNQSLGKITEKGLDDVWNSDAAQKIRASIHDGSFMYCNKMTCPSLKSETLLKKANIIDPELKNIIAKKTLTGPDCYPTDIVLSNDPTCNLTCPSCRDSSKKPDQKNLTHFDKYIFPKLFSRPVRSLRISGQGDPFASQYYMRLMKNIDPKKHDIKHFLLLTNAVLFSEKIWESLSNIHSFPLYITVSIDAATESTYSTVRRDGDWNRLQTALALISQLRKKEALKKFNFNFVVQNSNFHEMPLFIEMGKKLGVDNIYFSPYQKTASHITDAIYREAAVYLPAHPNYQQFIEIVNSPFMLDPVVSRTQF